MSETKKEPSTAEAFAIVRAFTRGETSLTISEVGDLVALLESRVGAMELAIRDVLELDAIGTPTTERDRRWAALESALTDAPPVNAETLRAAETRGFERAREMAADTVENMSAACHAAVEAFGESAARHIRAIKDETP